MNSGRSRRIDVPAELLDRILAGGPDVPDDLAIGYALDELSPDDRERLDELLACRGASEAEAREWREAVMAELDSLRDAAAPWRGEAGGRRLAALAQAWGGAVRVPGPESPRRGRIHDPAPLSPVQRLDEEFAGFVEQVRQQVLGMLEGAQAAMSDRRVVDQDPHFAVITRTDRGARVRFASRRERLAGAEICVEHAGDRRTYRMEIERPGVVSAEFVIKDSTATIDVVAPAISEPRKQR